MSYLIAESSRQLTLGANQGKWANNGSWDYTAVVRMGGGSAGTAENTAIIRLGRVVAQTGFHCIHTCDEAAFRTRAISVESLFNAVAECNRWLFNCNVEYDDHYGYPHIIDHQCYGDCAIAYTEVVGVFVRRAEIWA
jgi:hypothetical protein